MDNEIKKVLLKLERNGFEAYIVGGFVRDYIIGKKSYDIDICTNALPKEVIKIFKIKKGSDSYGSVSLIRGKYNFDITTYRMEENYNNHHPKSIKYINNLIADLERRDFTINTLCMNVDGKIFDYLNASSDIDNKIIKVVGNTENKLLEDPLRILRAIRFSVILDFELDDQIKEFINSNKSIIKSISFTRKKIELEKIFSSKNINKGFRLIKDFALEELLGISFENITCVNDILGIWSQISYDKNYNFSKNEMQSINNIREIISIGKISNRTILKYGLYCNQVAGEILNLDRSTINNMYNKMQIHKVSDLKISNYDIMNLLQTNYSNRIKNIYGDILQRVLDNELKNNKRIIKKYIIKHWM